jgi:hypothetical protein
MHQAQTQPGPTLSHPRSSRVAPPQIIRPILRALGAFVVLAGLGLGITLVIGATQAFNLLVWTLFTVLALAGAAAVAVSPGTLDDIWQAVRRRPLPLQAVVWLLFLPLMIALWIWERPWPAPVRGVLVLALNAWTIYVLFPRG